MSQILDAYGRPVQTETLREEQAAPTLTGIRNIFSIIDTSIGLTPDRIVGMLRQAEFGDPWLYLELAERMEEKDELYQGVLHTRKMAVTQLEITIEAASDSPEDQQDADFIREVLIDGDLTLHDALFDMLDALGKGFSATEIIWDTDGRNLQTGAPIWIPSALKWRDPRWFMFDWISGEQLLVRTLRTEGQTLPSAPIGSGQPMINAANLRIASGGIDGTTIGIQPMTAPLAPFKFITHVTRAKAGLPVRGGLARVAAWNYLFRNYILKDWVTFLEIYSQPLRLGKYGAGATEQDKNALLRAVGNIGTDAAAIIPDSMLIEFPTPSQADAHARSYKDALEYLDKRLTIAVLGQELTTSLPKGAGSRAAAEVHDVVRRDIATDDARRLEATLRRDLIKPLIDLNRGPRPRGHYPKISIGFEEEEDLKQLADALGPFIDRGLPVSAAAIQNKFGLEQPDPDELILHPAEKIAAQSGDGAAPAGQNGPPAAAADANLAPLFTDVDGENGSRRRSGESALSSEATGRERGPSPAPKDTPYLDKINVFVEKLRNQSDGAMAPIIKPLLGVLEGATSYDDLKRRLALAVSKMDHADLVELMARAGFNVNLAGQAGLKVHH